MKTKNNGERLVPGQKDTYRRSEMEFGVAADAYRSDPTKRATRNGAVMITIALAIVAFALMLGASVALASGLTLTDSAFRSSWPCCAFVGARLHGLGACRDHAPGSI